MDEGRKTMVKSSENKIITVQDNTKMDLGKQDNIKTDLGKQGSQVWDWIYICQVQ
jgi:hypothetical protein